MSILQSSFTGPINGPYVANPSASHVLICLHGFGSSGNDLIALVPALQLSLGNLGESLAVYSPNGISPAPGERGYQWFRDMGWTFRDAEGLKSAAIALDAFIAHIAATHNIPTSHIAIMGFSQGAMTLLHALPSFTYQPACAISCCGALTVTPSFPPAPNPQPILFIHGQDDDVLPADTSVHASQVFSNAGYPTQLEILPDLGHGIDARTIAHISVFLQTIWSPETSEEAAT